VDKAVERGFGRPGNILACNIAGMLFEVALRHSRIMRSNNPARDPRDTAHKHHSTPSLLLHGRDAQLREQVRGAAVDAPRLLEVLDGNVGNGLHAAATAHGAGVVDQDGGCADRIDYDGMHGADLCGNFSAKCESER
jgi:hypothetical protein